MTAADQLLLALIPEGAEVPGSTIRAAAREAGIPETSLRRAARRLGISIVRRGFGQGSVWLNGGNDPNGIPSIPTNPSSGGWGGNGVNPYGVPGPFPPSIPAAGPGP